MPTPRPHTLVRMQDTLWQAWLRHQNLAFVLALLLWLGSSVWLHGLMAPCEDSIAHIVVTFWLLFGLAISLLAWKLAHTLTHMQDDAEILHNAKIALKEQTQMLSAQEARQSAILRIMGEGIVHIDSKGKMLLVNDAILSMFGYEDVEDLVGRNVSVLMPEPHQSAHDDYLENISPPAAATSCADARD